MALPSLPAAVAISLNVASSAVAISLNVASSAYLARDVASAAYLAWGDLAGLPFVSYFCLLLALSWPSLDKYGAGKGAMRVMTWLLEAAMVNLFSCVLSSVLPMCVSVPIWSLTAFATRASLYALECVTAGRRWTREEAAIVQV